MSRKRAIFEEVAAPSAAPAVQPGAAERAKLRNRRIVHEAEDPETAVIFLDVVLGYGVHPDPAGAAVEAIQEAREVAEADGRRVIFIASVCGTQDDPQKLQDQEAKLEAAGVHVLSTNAAATRLAGHILS